MKRGIIILLLLLLPMFGFSQYKSTEDSLAHMKKIYDDYHTVNSDVGCLFGSGTFAVIGGTMLGTLLMTQGNRYENNTGKLIMVSSIVGGATLVSLSFTMRKKHKPKYNKYKRHYD